MRPSRREPPHHRRTSARRRPLLASLALLAACGGGSAQALEKIDSAAAMTTFTSDALRAHHVSRRYARATLRVLRAAMQEHATDAKAPAVVRARADSVRRAIDLALAATESR